MHTHSQMSVLLPRMSVCACVRVRVCVRVCVCVCACVRACAGRCRRALSRAALRFSAWEGQVTLECWRRRTARRVAAPPRPSTASLKSSQASILRHMPDLGFRHVTCVAVPGKYVARRARVRATHNSGEHIRRRCLANVYASAHPYGTAVVGVVYWPSNPRSAILYNAGPADGGVAGDVQCTPPLPHLCRFCHTVFRAFGPHLRLGRVYAVRS